MRSDENRPSTPGGQGDALAAWGLWGLLLVALGVTYTRLGPADLYHVSNDGFAGGMSRVLVAVNFPLALFAVAATLVALDALPTRWWLLGGPAIVLCASTAWPGVVDDTDLDARPVNMIPAIGVAIALALTVLAAHRTDGEYASRRPFDAVRIGAVVVLTLLSLPWLAADLGFFLPDIVFVTERPITGSDGMTAAAVHLGHHHGFDGALLIVSAMLLSRARLGSSRLAAVTTAYIALMFAYGAVNFAEDFLHEQLQKRGWISWRIPSALNPSLTAVWIVILGIAAAATLAMRHEDRSPPPERF